MEIDLDAILNQAKPWDLKLKIGGEWRSIRRCSNADLKRLFDSERYPEVANREFLTGLFEGDGNTTAAQLGTEQVSAVSSAIIAYYHKSITEKNAEAVAAAVTTAIRAQRGLSS